MFLQALLHLLYEFCNYFCVILHQFYVFHGHDIDAFTGDRVLTSDVTKDQGKMKSIRIEAPMSNVVRQPGCYLATASLVDNSNKRTILEWKWWFQVRAETEELEEVYIVSS